MAPRARDRRAARRSRRPRPSAATPGGRCPARARRTGFAAAAVAERAPRRPPRRGRARPTPMTGGPKAARRRRRRRWRPSATVGSTVAPRARQVRSVCEAAAANATPKYRTDADDAERRTRPSRRRTRPSRAAPAGRRCRSGSASGCPTWPASWPGALGAWPPRPGRRHRATRPRDRGRTATSSASPTASVRSAGSPLTHTLHDARTSANARTEPGDGRVEDRRRPWHPSRCRGRCRPPRGRRRRVGWWPWPGERTGGLPPLPSPAVPAGDPSPALRSWSGLLLVRHGQSTWNADGRWQGQEDPPLSTVGVRQAHDAARTLGTFDLVAASPLERALVHRDDHRRRARHRPRAHRPRPRGAPRRRVPGSHPARDRGALPGLPGRSAPARRAGRPTTTSSTAGHRCARPHRRAGRRRRHRARRHPRRRHQPASSASWAPRRDGRLPNLGGRWFDVGPACSAAGDAVLLVDADDVTVPDQI